MNAGRFSYLLALLKTNFRSALAQPWLTLTAAAMMLGNNLILFSIWWIYFAKFSTLGGWQLKDMAMLIGVVGWAFGLTVVVTGGVRDIAQHICDGRLDVYLGRPRHPLPALLLSRSVPSGLGDIASALIFWLWIAQCTWWQLGLAILLATAAGVILAATLTITQCIVFWLPRAQAFCEDLFNMVMMVVFYPQHPYAFFVRILLLTVFPTALIALLPVQAIREVSLVKGGIVLAASLLYPFIAKVVFDRGVRLYSSGNRMLEMR